MKQVVRQAVASAWVGAAALGLMGALLLTALRRVGMFSANPRAFDSDHLFCFALGRDVLGRGYALSGWHLPGPPYLFPDLALLLPSLAAPLDLSLQFLTYLLLFSVALTAGLFWVIRQTGVRPPEALLLAGAGVVLVSVAGFSGAGQDRGVNWFFPGIHAGVILAGLFLTALALRSLRQGWGPFSASAFVLAGGITAFSDRLLLVQFLAPIGLTVTLLALTGAIGGKRLAADLALLASATLLSLGLNRLFQKLDFVLLRVEKDFHFRGVGTSFRLFAHHLPESVWAMPVLRVVVPLFLLAALGVVGTRAGRVPGTKRPGPGAEGNFLPEPDRLCTLALVLIVLGSLLCSPSSVFLTGMWADSGHDRYLLPLVFLPCLFLGPFLRLLPWKVARGAGLLFPGVVLLFAAFQAHGWAGGLAWSRIEQPYPEVARALDELARQRGLRYGLSGFWSAKHLTFLSKEGVQVKAVARDGRPYLHADNPNTFLSPDPQDLTLPDFRFVYFSPTDQDPDRREVLRQYGEPEERRRAGDGELWIYRRITNPDWDLFLRGLLEGKIRRQRPFTGPGQPSGLATPREPFSPWDARGTVRLHPGRELEVRFSPPVRGRLLDVAGDSYDEYRVAFYQGEERLGEVVVPAVRWGGCSYDGPGMFARLVPLPEGVRDRDWDRAVIRALPGAGRGSLGHLLVFREGLTSP